MLICLDSDSDSPTTSGGIGGCRIQLVPRFSLINRGNFCISQSDGVLNSQSEVWMVMSLCLHFARHPHLQWEKPGRTNKAIGSRCLIEAIPVSGSSFLTKQAKNLPRP